MEGAAAGLTVLDTNQRRNARVYSYPAASVSLPLSAFYLCGSRIGEGAAGKAPRRRRAIGLAFTVAPACLTDYTLLYNPNTILKANHLLSPHTRPTCSPAATPGAPFASSAIIKTHVIPLQTIEGNLTAPAASRALFDRGESRSPAFLGPSKRGLVV